MAVEQHKTCRPGFPAHRHQPYREAAIWELELEPS
jgi:hypothetical protein